MVYECVMKLGTGKSSWHSNICVLDSGNGQCEAVITGMGMQFHIIAGKHKYGSCLCILNRDVACVVTDYADVSGNTEKLSGLLRRKVDAVTVATGLRCLDELVSAEWNQ